MKTNLTKISCNNNPNNYIVEEYIELNNHLILLVKFIEDDNNVSKNILVYKNTSFNEINEQKIIDPDFNDNVKYKCPIARFVPNELGMLLAVKFCEIMK